MAGASATAPVKEAVKVEEPAPEDRAWGLLDREEAGVLVVGEEPGYRYTWIRPADYPPDGREVQAIRSRMQSRGWEAVSGPLYTGPARHEYVPGRPDLEIWRMPQARWDNEWRVDMARQVLDRRSAERYWRHKKGGQVGGLPKHIEDAMFAFHGLVHYPGRPNPPSRDQLIAMVRRMPVHPGKEIESAW